MTKQEAWLTIADCAQQLCVSTKTVRRAIKRGELTAHKSKQVYRISPRDWRLYLAEHWPEAPAERQSSMPEEAVRSVRKSPALSKS
ncbi:helix-turn-helix domain-containing protein [Fodinicurvata fenggangensis]|uniref:helix-turn-helix domain-containing protein n=1 Tax=Fodinicurvata fenggangensis TaxID=1121830 RepID=UPI00138E1740